MQIHFNKKTLYSIPEQGIILTDLEGRVRDYVIAYRLGKGGSSEVFASGSSALVVDCTPAGLYTEIEPLFKTVVKHRSEWDKIQTALPLNTPHIRSIGGVCIPYFGTFCAKLGVVMEQLFPVTNINPQELLDLCKILWKNRILHRDIKPENLMQRADDTLIIIDWTDAIFLDEILDMDWVQFEELLDTKAASELYSPSDYGYKFGSLKLRVNLREGDLDALKLEYITLENHKEKFNVACTLFEIMYKELPELEGAKAPNVEIMLSKLGDSQLDQFIEISIGGPQHVEHSQ